MLLFSQGKIVSSQLACHLAWNMHGLRYVCGPDPAIIKKDSFVEHWC